MDAETLTLEWSEEALGILSALRQVLAERLTRAAAAGAKRHVEIGERALRLLELFVTQKPTSLRVATKDTLTVGAILYLDKAVAELRGVGIFAASDRLRKMGWTFRRGAGMHSPNRTVPRESVRSPEPKRTTSRVESPDDWRRGRSASRVYSPTR